MALLLFIVLALLLAPLSSLDTSAGGASNGTLDDAVAGRRLAITTSLPDGVQVQLGSEPVADQFSALGAVAGVLYPNGLRLQVPGQTFASSLNGVARLRVVLDGTQAAFGDCASAVHYVPGGSGFSDAALTLTVEDSGATLSSPGPLSFMFGGVYRLCFSHDGTFAVGAGQIAAAPATLKVRGASLRCGQDRCLEEYAWHCFVYADRSAPPFSCVVQLASAGAENYTQARLSWGPSVTSAADWSCGGVSSTRIAPGFAQALPATLGREYAVQARAADAASSSGALGAFSVQACYCASYDGSDAGDVACDSNADFVQKVGRVYFFAASPCQDPGCSTPYSQIAPGGPVFLRVECAGTSACSASSSNRLKIIDVHALGLNDYSSWVSNAGCRTSAQTAKYLLPTNCAPGSAASCGGVAGEMNGGAAQDAKVFSGIVIGAHYTSVLQMSRSYDICYCDNGCDESQDADAATRFRKVGQFHVTPLKHLRFAEFGPDKAPDVMAVAADIMVDGTANVQTVPHPAQMKLLWDNVRAKSSADCAGLSDLVEFNLGEGPTCNNADDCSYKASTAPTLAPDWFVAGGKVVTFNDGGTQAQRVKFKEPGVLAICYCGVIADGTGSQPAGECLRDGAISHWLLLTRTLIRGPCVMDALGVCSEQTWNFFTGVVFRLTVEGIGLRDTDKLRIIPSGDPCDGNPDGGGEATVLKNCPEACSSLSLTDTYRFGGGEGKDDIDVQLSGTSTVDCNKKNADCRTVNLQELLLRPDHAVWRFDAEPLLEQGDVVLLDNVSGGDAEMNALLAGQFGLNPLGWPVVATDHPREFHVKMQLGDVGGLPTFRPSGGWKRQSSATTKEELKATAAGDALQVCWGSGHDTYHGRAGRISFSDPAPMPEARLSPSSFEEGRPSPFIVSFTTSAGGDQAVRYKSALNSMQLKLAFDDVGKVEPLFADSDARPIEAVAPADRDELREAKQDVCGLLFVELWSNDANGFPLPKGCYYHSLMEGKRREILIVFEAKSGLEADRKYEIVMNARLAAGVSTLEPVLSVWSLDDVVLLPYSVLERGDARLSQSARRASSVGEPRFANSGGLQLLDESGQLRELVELTTDPTSLLFRLQGDGESRIAAGSVLRLFLRPLTVWDLPQVCQAQCFPHRTRVCGMVQSCTCDAIAPGSRRNVVKLQLPSTMDDIYGATVQHTVRVAELSLPSRGFFGVRFGAQVTPPDDSCAHYVEASSAWLWKAPSAERPPATLGSVVTKVGDGNDKPYRGDRDNSLYVALKLGASLRSELALGDAKLVLQLPIGYTCVAVKPTPSTLLFFDSAPQGRGTLPASLSTDSLQGAASGKWRLEENVCEYRLAPGELLPAGSRILLQLRVDHPKLPLPKATILNRWTVTLSSPGWYRKAPQTTRPEPLVGSAEMGFAFGVSDTNVAVLGRLAYDNLQPASFAADVATNLHVFFRPEQRSGYFGRVMVSAPKGFNFATVVPSTCVPSRLPDAYYREVGAAFKTEYLPIVRKCYSDCVQFGGCLDGALNRANIVIRNSLEADKVYGFRLAMLNKKDYEVADEDSWLISTADSAGNGLDASYTAARLNPAIGGTMKGWSVFAKSGDDTRVNVAFSSLTPTSLRAGTPSSVTLSPIEFPETITATCRLISPDGYDLTPADFLYHYASVPGTTASWPGQIPWQSRRANPGRSNPHGDQAKNVLIWNSVVYQAGEKYGFTAKITIPNRPVTATTQSFLLQFGWDAQELAARPIAWVIPLPSVRSLSNFDVRFSTNVVGSRNSVVFTLQTASEVLPGGRLLIRAPTGFIFEERCSPENVPGETPVPAFLACSAIATLLPDASASSAEISLRPIAEPLPPGRLSLRLRTRNPPDSRTCRGGQSTSCGYEECWYVEALDDANLEIDVAAAAPSFPLNRRMPEAKLVDLNYLQRLATGRDDRPGSANSLIFAFRLAERPRAASDLLLSGPYGFVFDEDCLPGLRIFEDKDNFDASVFGYVDWLPGYDRWEKTARVRSCVSTGSTVVMRVQPGLREGKLYVFRIGVAANPVVAPSPNYWTISYSGESCVPVEGFSLWTFADFSLTAVTTAASTETTQVTNPVTFRFRPHKEVNGDPLREGNGGMVRIIAPEGFAAASAGVSATYCDRFTLVELGASVAFVPHVDVQCRISEENSGMVSLKLLAEKQLEGGKLYELVVQFFNPRLLSATPAAWTVSTFSDPTASLQSSLDASTILGFPVTTPFYLWAVSPPPGEQHANAPVVDVSLEFALDSTIRAGSEVAIRSPPGFELSAPQQCVPYVGAVLGGVHQHVGFATSLAECAPQVWAAVREANAASWSTVDNRCWAHRGASSLHVCEPVDAPASAPASDSNASGAASNASRGLQGGVAQKDCGTYEFHVCSFAAESRACNNFRYREGGPLSTVPICEGNNMYFRLAGADELLATAVVSFYITTSNPRNNPDITKDYWIIEQLTISAEVIYSRTAPGWAVIPLLEEASVRLSGPLQSSGSVSELTVDFLPFTAGDRVEIYVLSPVGFDFSNAVVDGGADNTRTVLSKERTSIAISCEVIGGQKLASPIVVRNVVLGLPGPAAFRLVTYMGTSKADEALRVDALAAFVVPGNIEVTSAKLETTQSLDATAFPYRSKFQPRINETAIATFVLRFGSSVAFGDELVISAPPFDFPRGAMVKLFELKAIGSERAIRLGAASGQPPNLVDGPMLRARLLEPLQSGGLGYRLMFETHTGPTTANGEKWLFATFPADANAASSAVRGAKLPSNTNDATTEGFGLVPAIPLTLSFGRVAPRSRASLELVVDPSGSMPTTLVLYAPRIFRFPVGSCLDGEPAQTAKILSCRRLEEENVVELQLAGAGLAVAAKTKILIDSPDLQSDDDANTWVIQAKMQDREVGWGQAQGFRLTQMAEALFIYAGAPSVRQHMAVVFTTTENVDKARIDLIVLEVYKLSCHPADGFNPLGLKDYESCDDSGLGLRIHLNGTLTPGRYVFLIGVTNPAFTPPENRFSILIREQSGNVVDAYMHKEGERILRGLYLRPPLLRFSSSTKKAQAEIEVTLRVSNALDPMEALGAVRALQIAVPERFTLVTRMPVLNKDGLPTPETSWYHLYYTDRLVRIDVCKSDTVEPKTIPAGDYRLSFQVRIPEFFMPTVNLFLLSLCRDVRCTDLIATMPIPGFQHGDPPQLEAEGADGAAVAATSEQEVRGAATRRRGSAAAALCLASLLALSLALREPLAR